MSLAQQSSCSPTFWYSLSCSDQHGWSLFYSGYAPGGPYVLEVTYVGYKNKQVKGISLSLGQNTVLNETLAEDAAQLEDVVVVANRNNNMRTDRAGATTSIDATHIEAIPTVSRSMNDLLKLTPQASTVGGFSVGGGNFRQSYVTVDGAAFNNAFGIGSTFLVMAHQSHLMHWIRYLYLHLLLMSV